MNSILIGSIRRRSGSIIFILCVVCISVYFNSLFCGFVYDDNYLIVNNPYIKNPHFIKQVFSRCLYNATTELAKPDYYRPLQAISLATDYRLWKLNPFGYHLTNIVIHFLNGALIYFIVYLLFNNLFIALITSILFCAHPIHTSAVTYVSGRADLLAGLFMLSVFLFTILGIRYQKRRGLYFFLAILFTLLALFSRENALFIPLGIALLSFFTEGSKKYKIALLFSCVLIVSLYLLFRIKLLHMPIAEYPAIYLKPYLKVTNFLYGIICYASLLIFPINLHLMRTILPISSTEDIRLWIALASFAILIIVFYLRRNNKILTFGLAWFLIFTIQSFFLMDKFSGQRLSIREHWAYLASAGFFIIISYLLDKIKRHCKIIAYAFAGICLLAYGALTIVNNINFKNDFMLSEYLLKYEPGNIEIYKILINAFLENKEYDRAFAYIDEAEKIDSHDPDLYVLKARYFEGIGNIEKAIDSYGSLLRALPNSGRANNNLGAIYFDKGDYDKAKIFFKKAIAANPALYEPYLNMANLSGKNNDASNAIYFYRQAIQLNPGIKDAYLELARIYIKEARLKEAQDLLNNALAYGHREAPVLIMLGTVSDRLGFEDKALYYFKKALSQDPKSQEAMLNIGIFYANHNHLDKAVKIWEEALSVNPNNEIIRQNLRRAEGIRK